MTKYGLAAVVLLGVGCKKEVTDPDEIPDNVATGEVVVTLETDDPGEVSSSVEEVFVRIEDVLIHHETQGWITIANERQDVDLMTVHLGESQEIGRADVYEGAYDTLRVVIADSWIVVDGVETDLTIDEGLGLPAEGIDFNESFFVDENSTTMLAVDFDLDSQLIDNEGVWELGADATVTVDIGD